MADERPPKRRREEGEDDGEGNEGGMDKSMGKPMSLLRMRNHSTPVVFKRRWVQEIGQWQPTGSGYNVFCPNYNSYEFYTRKTPGDVKPMDMWEWFTRSQYVYGSETLKTFTNFMPLLANMRVSNMIPLQTGLQVPQGVVTTTFNNTPYMIIAEDSTGTHQVIQGPGNVSEILQKNSIRLKDSTFLQDPIECFASTTMFREGDVYEKTVDFRKGLGPLKYANEFDGTVLQYLPNQFNNSSCYQPYDATNNFSHNQQGYGQQNFIAMTMPYVQSIASGETAIKLKSAVTIETELVIEAFFMGPNQIQMLNHPSTLNGPMYADSAGYSNYTIQRANGLQLQRENTNDTKQYKFSNWAY